MTREFMTTGDIARRLNEQGYDLDLGHVSYALRRLKIRPMARAGVTRLFAVTAIEAVRAYLDGKHEAVGTEATNTESLPLRGDNFRQRRSTILVGGR